MEGKEAYEARKAEKDQARAEDKRSQSLSHMGRNLFITVIVIVVAILIVYGLFIVAEKSGPKGEDFSREVEVMASRDHIELGAELPIYTSNPPTSGPHYGTPASTGFRGDAGLPDGHYIHTMEHGNIWISYHPDVAGLEVVEDLEEIASNRVVISERAENETDIAVAAWGRLDTFDVGDELTVEDKQRINDFILRYTDKAPEQLPSTAHSQGI